MEACEYDIVCIGAGGAGVTAAITAAAAGARVLLVSKDPIGYGNTRISVGVVASCGILPPDTPDLFYEDLVVGGEHLNNPKLARVMAEESALAPAIAESQGALFARDAGGGISRGVAMRAGGHRHKRSVKAHGKGIGLGQALRAAAARSAVDVLEETVTVKLLSDGGRVAGLVAWDLAAGEPVVVRAPAVILATGGLGWMYYPHTDCMRSATGDGYALAYEAGAELVDMEQVQFLPFSCTRPASMVGIFLGEPSFVGPQGRLLDARERELLVGIETMTRAQVSRVMALELREGHGTPHGGLLLDLRQNLETPRGRAAWQTMKDVGLLDIAKRAYGPKAYAWQEPWEVVPTVHFHMGGLRIDEHGATSLPGLYAAGEAAGGVHGACRLGSVALAELFVFGRRAGLAAADFARGADRPPLPRDEAAEAAAQAAGLPGTRGEHRPVALVRRLQRLMWDKVGAVRDGTELSAAAAELRDLTDQARSLRLGPERRQNLDVLDAVELRLMLLTADIVARSALCRQETRGAHIRADYPDRDDARWLANIVARRQNGGLSLAVEPLAGAP
ncbi:MAG: FAD-binding protein [Candidatus Rokubacteria bacterium]|nr:FAD-binding protein [Candidatus Rokubacteria bacterium]